MIVEAFLLILLGTLCIYSSYTDIRYSIVPNKVLLMAAVLATPLNVYYYLIYYQNGIHSFLINILVAALFSISLYAAHIWAAGDSKFIITTVYCIPARIISYDDGHLNSLMIIVFSFILSFAYLIIDAIYSFFTNKKQFQKDNFWKKLKIYLMRLFVSSIIMMLLLKIEIYFSIHVFFINQIAWTIINFVILLLISNIKKLYNIKIIIAMIVASVVTSAVTHIWLFQVSRIIYYIFIAVFILIETFVGEFNYKTIPIDTVRSGMVLSKFTCMMMALSGDTALPLHTTEDLQSRLTEEEAENVRNWGKTTKKIENVQIVRKIPFVIFLSIGIMLYFIMAWFIRTH